jgi:hypothetical protein
VSDRSTRQPLSRADQLRQRREQPSRMPVMPVKKETPEPTKLPVTNPFGRTAGNTVQQPAKRAAVVTTRSFPYSTPLRETVSTPVRRKLFSTNAKGVETRLPSLPMLRFSWQWVSGFLTFALLVLVSLMLFLDAFKVKEITVDGNKRVALADIQTVVMNNSHSIFTLDRQKVITAIGLTYPELHDIQMKVNLSGKLSLSVQEREPTLAWVVGDKTFWVDAEGVLLTPRGDAGTLMTIRSDSSFPVTKPVTPINNAVDYANLLLDRKENPIKPEDLINHVDPYVLKAAIDLNTQMPSGAMLVYDPISGMGWQDPRGWKVYFGLSLDDIQFKEVEYAAIVDRLTQLGIKPKLISVEHVDSPFYRSK